MGSEMCIRDSFYTAQNLLVVAVGNVDVAALIGDLEEKLCTLPQTSAPQPRILPYIWEPAASFASIKKDTEQVHICLGLPGYSYCDRKKYAMMAVSNILGGSMSSRLFQRVREELGMAYSIYSYPSVFSEAGMLCIYAGTSPANAQKVTQEIIRQMERFKITEEELANTKEQLKGNFILAQESMSTKMNALGKNIMLTGGYNTESDVLHYIDCVCMRDIDAAVSHMFDTSRMTGIYVGARDVSSMRPLFIKED